jgi:hypothetical protein
MSVTISFYNHTRKMFANKEVNFANLKVMLRDNTTAYDPEHIEISSLSGAEVHGNGWTQGGVTIQNVAVTVVGTNGSKLSGNNISVTATTGSIGPARKAVIYDPTVIDLLLFFIDFGVDKEAPEGTDFRINWDTNGIQRWLEPS